MQLPDNGIVDLPCSQSAQATVERLKAILTGQGIKIFATIDQAVEAQSVGLSMCPTVLIIFGDARAGTPLMNSYPSLAMDLPLKALVWQDPAGKVWLSYNSPAFLKERHDLPQEPFQPVSNLLTRAAEPG